MHRPLGQELFHKPAVLFQQILNDFEGDEIVTELTERRYLFPVEDSLLPDNVHLLSIELTHEQRLLVWLFALMRNTSTFFSQVRFEHFFDVGESQIYSSPATFNIMVLW